MDALANYFILFPLSTVSQAAHYEDVSCLSIYMKINILSIDEAGKPYGSHEHVRDLFGTSMSFRVLVCYFVDANDLSCFLYSLHKYSNILMIDMLVCLTQQMIFTYARPRNAQCHIH